MRGDPNLFFGGDHLIRQSWFVRDQRTGRQAPQPYQKLANETTRRLRMFVEEFPTLLLPSHDAEAAQNLAAMQPLKV